MEKKITVSCKKAKKLTFSRKKAKILTVDRKSHHPIETLYYIMHVCSVLSFVGLMSETYTVLLYQSIAFIH